jgi:AMP-polyphosphate phosphotransferase
MFKTPKSRTSGNRAVLSDAAFREVKDRLRFELVDLQQRCRLAADFPIIIVVSGIQGAGGVDTLNLLNTWMDPRWIHTHATDVPSDEERERPLFWRYWRSLPAAGNIGLYLDGWYGDAVAAHCRRQTSAGTFATHLKRIAAFERTLADNGALIVKLWLHLDKSEHRKADTHRVDPVFGFRASDAAWPQPAAYDAFTAVAAKSLRATSTTQAPWHIIDGADDNYRRATVLTILRDAMKAHRKSWRKKSKAAAKEIKRARKHDKKNSPPKKARSGALVKVNLSRTMSPAAYARAFRTLQARLYELQKAARSAGLSTVIAFEGWDAAGKGGAIRRLTYALSARNYRVVPISAPNDDERAHHYLWRFWRHLGRAGHMSLFDRTWYGRVLVERVEHLITEEAWRRSYGEINDFEAQLAEHGTVVLKFWLHIDPHEQLRRFKEREETPYKKWKITDDDWRNRAKWNRYETAVNDMIAATSTKHAPWHLVPANDKRYGRVMILDIVIKALESALRTRKAK